MARTYTKHDVTEIAVKASKLGSGFRASELGTYPVIRRATTVGIIRPLKGTIRTGGKGRPAFRYSLTSKGRSIARKAI